MRNTADVHLDGVVKALQRYLSSHPGAADSEFGIAQWWLSDWQQATGEVPSSDEVAKALGRLQELGEIELLNVSGVGRLWRAVSIV